MYLKEGLRRVPVAISDSLAWRQVAAANVKARVRCPGPLSIAVENQLALLANSFVYVSPRLADLPL